MLQKKTRIRIPKESKTRAELQKKINSVCPFCVNTDVGHFQIHHIDDNPSNNQKLNLILLGPICHSKITKGDYSSLEVYQKKIQLLQKAEKSNSNLINPITFNGKVINAIVGNNNLVSIIKTKKPTKKIIQKYPEGCIGFDNVKANYISHLISRFNVYKEYEVGKGKMNFSIFSSQLKKRYKIRPTRTLYNLSIEKFQDLVMHIHSKIDGTKLAKIKGNGHKNYSNFKEYVAEKQALYIVRLFKLYLQVNPRHFYFYSISIDNKFANRNGNKKTNYLFR